MSSDNADYIASVFLDALEKMTAPADGSAPSRFFVRTAGKTVRMQYPDREKACKAMEGFRKFIVPETADYTASFIFCEARFRDFLPEEYIGYCRILSTPGYRMRYTPGAFISFADYKKQNYYYCTEPKRVFIGSHEMVAPYYLWGMNNDLILTHSACVGTGGKGILLAANGGGGKSTLSVGCLMHGLDFVSDDYTLLSGSGKLYGMPVYSDIGLTPDSYEMLKPPYPVHWINEANRDKKFMDIADEACFADKIEIKGLVAPKITGGETRIYEIDNRQTVSAFYHSSMKQVIGNGDKDYALTFIRRLKDLKAWQIELGPDLDYNAEFLRNFIMKEF